VTNIAVDALSIPISLVLEWSIGKREVNLREVMSTLSVICGVVFSLSFYKSKGETLEGN